MLPRRRRGTESLPFTMPLCPLPVIVSVPIGLFVRASTGKYAAWGTGMAALGVLVFYLTEKHGHKQLNVVDLSP